MADRLVCPRCAKTYATAATLAKHLQRANPCDAPRAPAAQGAPAAPVGEPAAQLVPAAAPVARAAGAPLERAVWAARDIMRAAGVTGMAALDTLVSVLMLREVERVFPRYSDPATFELPKRFDDSGVIHGIRSGLVLFSRIAGAQFDENRANEWHDIVRAALRALAYHPDTRGGAAPLYADVTVTCPLTDSRAMYDLVRHVRDHIVFDARVDTIGRIYMSIIRDFAGENTELGQHFTPPVVVNYLIAAASAGVDGAARPLGRVIDPTCGSGSFLVAAAAAGATDVAGIELMCNVAPIASLAVFLAGRPGGVVQNNFLRAPMPGAPYDTVLANPPFGQTITKQQREDHKRALADGAATYPLTTTPTGLFLQRIVRVLAVGGRACVVLPLGRELSGRTPADVLFRRALLHAVAMREVVVIPSGQFECTGVRTAAIVFDKVRELGDCVIAGARGTATLNPDIPTATESFRFVAVVDGAAPTSAPVSGVRAVVTAADLAAAAWSLSPDDYKTAQADAPPAGLYPLVRLGDLCTLSPGTSFSKASIVSGEFPVVGGGTKPMGMHNAHNTAAGVTIISATGAAGSVSKYNTPAYCTADALRLTTYANANSKFVHYYLSTVAANMLTQMRTGMAQPHFNKRAFAELTIPLPPIETQCAIAAELDRQAQAIAQIESAVQSLEGAKLVVLRNALYKWGHIGFVADGRREFADGVVIRALHEMCDVAIGGTPATSSPEYYSEQRGGDGVVWVTISDLMNGGIITNTKTQLTIAGVNASSTKLVRAGTVLFSFKLTIGRVGIAGVNLYTNEAIAALPVIEPNVVAVNYLYHTLKLKHYTQPEKRGMIGAGSLSKESVKQITIPLLPIESQHIIAAELDRLDMNIAELTRHVAALRTAMKSSLERALRADAPAPENVAAVDLLDDAHDDDTPDDDEPGDDVAELLDAGE